MAEVDVSPEAPDGSGDAARAESSETRRRVEDFWGKTLSGARIVGRPIVIDGLSRPRVEIELAPRVKWVADELVDDSYHAVEQAAKQLYQSFTLDQLVMATVALQVYMRKTRAHLDKKKRLQERWTELARRMKKLRVAEEHLAMDEQRLREKKADVPASMNDSGHYRLGQLFDLEAREIKESRKALDAEKAKAHGDWVGLEQEDEELLREAPQFEQSEDLRYPFVLVLNAPANDPGRPRRRSLASAMNTLVEAMQKPLSRTDQMLLEIALRRCVQALIADDAAPEKLERELLRAAEQEFAEQFPWAEPYVMPGR